MRSLVVVAVLCGLPLASACLPGDRDAATIEDPAEPGGAPGGALEACAVDADCALAASSCCGCPEFAVSLADPAYQACAGVPCPDAGGACPANVRAACAAGACVVACEPLACPASCEAGFAVDATGCLTCACAGAADLGGCTTDADCVQTRADCCGCAQGGADTAVLAGERAAFDAALACPAAPACPAVDVCDPAAAPRCLQGACSLAPAASPPPGACGRADLPACPAGQVCVVNLSPAASQDGIGVCGAL